MIKAYEFLECAEKPKVERRFDNDELKTLHPQLREWGVWEIAPVMDLTLRGWIKDTHERPEEYGITDRARMLGYSMILSVDGDLVDLSCSPINIAEMGHKAEVLGGAWTRGSENATQKLIEGLTEYAKRANPEELRGEFIQKWNADAPYLNWRIREHYFPQLAEPPRAVA